jgi:hypothetical protein
MFAARNILLAASAAWAGEPGFDATGSGTDFSVSEGQTFSWSHTAGPGVSYVIVALSRTVWAGTPTFTATYGGVPMTLLVDSNVALVAFGLGSPPGGTQTVVVTATGAGSVSTGTANSMSLKGLALSGPAITTDLDYGDHQVTVASPAGGLSVYVGGWGYSAHGTLIGATEHLYQDNGGGVSILMGTAQGIGANQFIRINNGQYGTSLGLSFKRIPSLIPKFDAIGTPWATGAGGGTPTVSHTAAAGAYVFAAIWANYANATAATYGGNAMTKIGSYAGSYSCMDVFAIGPVSAGTASIVFTIANETNLIANSVSYTGVSSVGAERETSGSGSPASQRLTCSPDQALVQFIGGYSTAGMSVSGGTNRYNGDFDAGWHWLLGINEATAETTFTGTESTLGNWGGLGFEIGPPSSSPPKIHELTDDFTANSIGTGLNWNYTYGGQQAITGGQLVLTLPTSETSSGIIHDYGTYLVNDSFVAVEIVAPSDDEVQCGLALYCGSNAVGYLSRLTGSGLLWPTGTVEYNATDHRWLRIDYYGNTVCYSASPDGVTWKQLGTSTSDLEGFARVDLWAYASADFTGGPADVLFDNFNLLP